MDSNGKDKKNNLPGQMICNYCNNKRHMAKDLCARVRVEDKSFNKISATTNNNTSKLFTMNSKLSKPRMTSARIDADTVVDRGAPEYVVSCSSYLFDTQQADPITIELANGASITAMLTAKIELNTGIRRVEIIKAYYIPAMKMNILSYSRLDERGISTKISEENVRYLVEVMEKFSQKWKEINQMASSQQDY